MAYRLGRDNRALYPPHSDRTGEGSAVLEDDGVRSDDGPTVQRIGRLLLGSNPPSLMCSECFSAVATLDRM
jgi:hypothetical protein